MMGSFLTRGLAMVFGYAYPAYECFKTVEKNKPDIEQLRFWCQYWILVALMTIFERVGDAFISWVPMYSEAKLAFFIYLWYPKTKGTTYVYDSFFRPYLAKHETEIDRNLLELRTRAEDFAVMYWQKAASYGQTRVFEILQYIASQSSSRPRPAQPQPYGEGARQSPAAVSPRQPATTRQQPQQPPSHTSSASSTQQQQEAAQPAGPPPAPVASATHSKTAAAIQSAATPAAAIQSAATTAAAIHLQTTAASDSAAESSSQSTKNEAEAMVTETASSLPSETGNPPPKETIMEVAHRVTRGKLRKNNSAASR